MEISLKLRNEEQIRLKPLRFRDKKEDENVFRFVPLTGGQVYLSIELNGSQYKILSLDKEIDETETDLRNIIEEWLVVQNPDKSFGTEDSEVDDEEENDPYDPDSIRVDTKQFSLRQIYDMIRAGDIDLTPDFQRHLVWDNTRKSRLIESILLRIPLPMFYFAQDEEGRISVVDGLQRLSTIREFMDNQFRLKKLEYLEARCGDKFYQHPDRNKAIDAKYFRWFNMTQITVNVIDPSSPFKLKYDIFRRINTGGQPLNSQEIRNCLSSDALRQTLREMAHLESFKLATGWSVKDVRMESQELALRFILFFSKFSEDHSLSNYSGNMDSELNSLTEELSKDKQNDYNVFISLFDNAMKNCYHLFGEYCFRKVKLEHLQPGAKRQLINKALFVSWSVTLSRIDSNIINNAPRNLLVVPLAKIITEDVDLYNYLTYGTNSKANIKAAFDAAAFIINENLSS